MYSKMYPPIAKFWREHWVWAMNPTKAPVCWIVATILSTWWIDTLSMTTTDLSFAVFPPVYLKQGGRPPCLILKHQRKGVEYEAIKWEWESLH